MGVFDWILDFVQGKTRSDRIYSVLEAAAHRGELDQVWATLSADDQSDLLVLAHLPVLRAINAVQSSDLANPVDALLGFALDKWVEHAAQFQNAAPEEAQQKLQDEIKFMIKTMGELHAAQKILQKVPWMNSPTLDENMKKLFAWLGFGAVLNAIAHDPVKIGLLRPWQDNLEATFRNKRFDHIETLNAYRQRSLSTIPVPDIDMITDEIMDEIEDDNNTNLFGFMAKHGFKDDYIKIMQDASTRALTFGNLSAMAKMGHYNRQEAIFSLWTFGMDRRIMRSSLAALETMRDVGLWKGFRSMVEPGYVQGLIEAEDVREYWSRILVPQQVQDWAMLRLTRSREKFAAKEAKQLQGLQKNLSQANWTKAYKLALISRADLVTKLISLGFDAEEAELLAKIADKEIKPEAAAACKKLPLSDYELAHRNGILSLAQVLERMTGEYCQADIDLESQLLQIDDLTAEAPARERDLAAGTVATAYSEGIMTAEAAKAYWEKLGYDAQEIATLQGMAEIKREAYQAKKARDEALEEARAAKLALQQARAGLKRLPLSDYEKAWQHGLITEAQLLERMRLEYDEFDIGLEKMMLANGIARKG